MIAKIIDSTIGALSPSTQLKRILARKSIAVANGLKTRKFEAASFSDKTKGWFAPKTSALVDTKLYLNTLRDRSRDTVRNTPIGRRAVEVMVQNIIGTGIVPQLHDENESRRRKIEVLLKRFIDECDHYGRLDFYGLQAMWVKSMLTDGESLIRYSRETGSTPLKLQTLESDFIDSFREGYLEDGIICQGVEFDQDQGKPRAYWLYRNHPGGFIFNGFTGDSLRVPSSEIVHCFKLERPGQCRGLPLLTPAMLKIRDLDQYAFAQLWRQKVSACYAAFVMDTTEQLDPLASKNDDYLEDLQPGAIEYLPPGREVKFSDPPDAPNYPEYVRACMREIASALGISYEALSGDYSQVNFSSARMGWLEFHRTIQSYQWGTVIPSLLTPIMNEFLKTVQISGIDTSGVKITFTPPRRDMLDPVEEIESMSAGIRNGFFSLSECIRELGFEPEQRLQELSKDMKLAQSLGLKLECFSKEGDETNATQSDPDSVSDSKEETNNNPSGRSRRKRRERQERRKRRWR
jgi:lambda family phage portal protein